MKLISFAARCQDKTIQEQYELGVRCFDLHLRYEYFLIRVVHGPVVYNYKLSQLQDDLKWLNGKKDVAVRLLLDTRTKKSYTEEQRTWFDSSCRIWEEMFPHIQFWCGRNLYNWEVEYNFQTEPSCEEKYSSVCKPRIWDNWWPRFFAWRNNKKIKKEGTTKDFLLIDFVQYG